MEELVTDDAPVIGVINWTELFEKMDGKDFKEMFARLIQEKDELGIPRIFAPVNQI